MRVRTQAPERPSALTMAGGPGRGCPGGAWIPYSNVKRGKRAYKRRPQSKPFGSQELTSVSLSLAHLECSHLGQQVQSSGRRAAAGLSQGPSQPHAQEARQPRGHRDTSLEAPPPLRPAPRGPGHRGNWGVWSQGCRTPTVCLPLPGKCPISVCRTQSTGPPDPPSQTVGRLQSPRPPPQGQGDGAPPYLLSGDTVWGHGWR